MLGLDLNFGQKLQVGFIVLMFSLTGYFIFRAMRSQPETTVTSWVQPVYVGIDPSKPVGRDNPADPARTIKLTIFACHDGRLEIREFPQDSGAKASFTFLPDRQRKSYDFYKDPVNQISGISDPYKRTLALAAFTVAWHHPSLGILNKTGLTAEQLKAEKQLRDAMLLAVDGIEQGAQTGMYQPELHDNVLRALADYQAKDGDPSKDSAKAALAHKVMDASMAYIEKIHKEEAVFVQKYIDGMDTILNSDQKTKLAAAGKNLNPNAGAKPQRNKPAPT